jgi:excisionase family DNA binding protein
MIIDQLLTPRRVAELEGCGITTVYQRLKDREYEAVKDGRKTLITAESVARRRKKLPSAQYGIHTGIKGFRGRPAAAP